MVKDNLTIRQLGNDFSIKIKTKTMIKIMIFTPIVKVR